MIRPNADAELAVIGAMIVSPDEVLPEAEQILSEDDFLIDRHRTMYRACSGFFMDGKPVDTVTLLAQLGDEYRVPIHEAVASMPSTRNWRSYAEAVIGTAKRRRAYELAAALLEGLEYGELDECQEEAGRICQVLAGNPEGRAVSAKEGYRRFLEDLKRTPRYIPTGFERIDKHLFLEPGDFVIVGARPSVGKTALTLQMLAQIARKHRCVYFSLETKAEKLTSRLAANITGVDYSSIKRRAGFDSSKLWDAIRVFDGLDYYLEEAAGWTVAQIKARAIQLGAEVIFVDYLGLVSSEGKGRYEKTTNASIDLHVLAQSTGIAVIAVQQLNRAGTGEPSMEHLRESGQLEQDADAILLLHAPDGNDGQAREVNIAKNKEGHVGYVPLVFDGSIQRFYSVKQGGES